jgi:hypothetical protein
MSQSTRRGEEWPWFIAKRVKAEAGPCPAHILSAKRNGKEKILYDVSRSDVCAQALARA